MNAELVSFLCLRSISMWTHRVTGLTGSGLRADLGKLADEDSRTVLFE
jgi:hypothetical protein